MTENASFTVRGFLANGVSVIFTEIIEKGSDPYTVALHFTNKLLEQGFSETRPGLGEGEESETIVTVMRRAKADGTAIIDFYPEWGNGSDKPYGTYKYAHEYMDYEKEVQFLKASGFHRLDDIPLYESQSPLQRTPGRPNPKETKVPTPFQVVRKQGAEKLGSDGKPFRPWEIVGYKLADGTFIPVRADEGKPVAAPPLPPPAPVASWPNASEIKSLIDRALSSDKMHGITLVELRQVTGIDNLDDVEAWGKYASMSEAAKAIKDGWDAFLRSLPPATPRNAFGHKESVDASHP